MVCLEITISCAVLQGKYGRKSRSLTENFWSWNTGSQKEKYFFHLWQGGEGPEKGPSSPSKKLPSGCQGHLYQHRLVKSMNADGVRKTLISAGENVNTAECVYVWSGWLRIVNQLICIHIRLKMLFIVSCWQFYCWLMNMTITLPGATLPRAA